MSDLPLIERITRSLAFMLRHQPEQFDLELDAYGFADVGAVVRALNERLGEPVRESDLTEAVESGDRVRYEIQGERIRALYGHSIPVEPGDASKPPETLYVAIPERDLDRARRFGLRGGRRRFLHLALTEDDAREAGRRGARDYCVLSIRSLDAWEEGVNFFDRRSLWLAEEVPTHLLDLGETYHDGTERDPRASGGRPSGGRSSAGGRGRGRGRGGRRDRGGRGSREDREPRRESEEERPEEPRREPAGDVGEREGESDRGSNGRGEDRSRGRREEREERPRRSQGGDRGKRPERERPERPERSDRERAEPRQAPAEAPKKAREPRRPAPASSFGAGLVEPRSPAKAAPESSSEPRKKPRPEARPKAPEPKQASPAPAPSDSSGSSGSSASSGSGFGAGL